MAKTTVNNGTVDVPSLLLTPVAVDNDNLADTVIKDGFTTKEKLCVDAAKQSAFCSAP
jgi:D-xylose transport system substrate-binding protein